MNSSGQNSFNYELLIAVLALIVSAVSIFLTIWTINIQRHHNRLSVKPIPEILLSAMEGIKIDLKNLGVGPLICKQLFTKDEDGNTKYHLVDYLPQGLSFTDGQIFTNRWDFTLLPGDTITLFSIKKDLTNPNSVESISKAMEFLSVVKLELTYTSIYEEEFPIYIKKLTWFKNPK